MHIHEQVLLAAQAAASANRDWTFTLNAVVQALPHLNVSSVRTHVVSRCCVDAPKNHLHKWDYFRRVARGKYQIQPPYRKKISRREATRGMRVAATALRDTVHFLVSDDNNSYVAECMELPVVTQAPSLDELITNIREALGLHLESEDLAELGLRKNPRLHLMYELSQPV